MDSAIVCICSSSCGIWNSTEFERNCQRWGSFDFLACCVFFKTAVGVWQRISIPWQTDANIHPFLVPVTEALCWLRTYIEASLKVNITGIWQTTYTSFWSAEWICTRLTFCLHSPNELFSFLRVYRILSYMQRSWAERVRHLSSACRCSIVVGGDVCTQGEH